jgi:hypothetical protein
MKFIIEKYCPKCDCVTWFKNSIDCQKCEETKKSFKRVSSLDDYRFYRRHMCPKRPVQEKKISAFDSGKERINKSLGTLAESIRIIERAITPILRPKKKAYSYNKNAVARTENKSELEVFIDSTESTIDTFSEQLEELKERCCL